MMDSKQVGDLISKLRKENGWTQIQLAEKLHLSDKAISKWERGDGMPEVSQFPAMAKLFGVTTDYLLTGEDGTSISNVSNLEKACKNGVRAVEKLGITKDEYGKTILDYALKYEDAKLIVYCIEKGVIKKGRPIRVNSDMNHIISATKEVPSVFEPEKPKKEEVLNIYKILLKNNEFEVLQKINFFSLANIYYFKGEWLLDIFSEATDKVGQYIEHSSTAINAYLLSLVNQKSEKKFVNYLKKSESDLEAGKKASEEAKNNGTNRYNHLSEGQKIVLREKTLRISPNITEDVIRNFSYETSSRFIKLTKPALNEDIIRTIQKKGYQKLYDMFKKEEILKFNEFIIAIGDIEVLEKYIDIIDFDIDALIKEKNMIWQLRFLRKEKNILICLMVM